jgi:carbon monoxide dehydrogenase subunit G
MPIHCEIDLEIARPADAVFAFLDDPDKAPTWLGRCVKLERVGDARGKGAKLKYTYKDPGRTGTMDGEVTAWEKDRLLELHYVDKMMEVSIKFELEPAGGSTTKVHHAVEIQPRGFFMKLMSPMIRSATRKQITKDTAKLRSILEAM